MSSLAPQLGTDDFGRLAVASPIDDLESIAPLILDLQKREKVLAEFDGPRRLAAEEIFQCAARLTSITEWPEDQLLKQLGCTLTTVGKFTGVKLVGLKRCQSFMRLVTRESGLVETLPDRRRVVAGLPRLLKAIGSDVTYLTKLMKTKVDRYTAIDFIRLGEFDAASDQVRGLANASGTGQVRSEDDPFAETSPVHISTTRLDMLAEGHRKELGEEVANHMTLHIEKCPGCRDAYSYRVSALDK